MASDTGPRKVDEISLQKCLGRGFFGEVWQAEAEVNGVRGTFAVKKVRLSLISENRLMDQLKREIQILYALRHPRCVQLHFDFSDDKHMYLGMEFATGGTLFDKLNAAQKFSSTVAARYFLEMCEALDYLHHLPEKVIHRDIKPENILLDSEDHIKLADFGWANMMEANKRTTFCGTLDYLPPEMIMGTGHDESIDMWNMGVLLYELVTGQSPFGTSSKEATCRMILAVDLRFSEGFDKDARDLVVSLCKKTPAERLPVRAAMKHKFVTQYCGQQVDKVLAVPVADDARPSVVSRHAQADREKYETSIQLLLQAKQQTDDSLLCLTRELDETHMAIQEEQKRCMEVMAKGKQMESACDDREKELIQLRKRKEELELEAIKSARTASGGGWFSRFGKQASSDATSPSSSPSKPPSGGYNTSPAR